MGVARRVEAKRGCGYRKPGGMYLVADGLAVPCGKLPIPLEVCPCCGTGVKPSRGWTWVNGTQLAETKVCSKSGSRSCAVCPLSKPMGRVGLLWVGEAFYGSVDAFCREAQDQGVSRRISAVPNGFKVGETWVWLAHRKAIKNPDDSWTAGVFQTFKPQAIEYVVKGNETQQELDALEERGLTLVQVVKDTEALFAESK